MPEIDKKQVFSRMHMRLAKLKNSPNKTRCYSNPSGKAAKNG